MFELGSLGEKIVLFEFLLLSGIEIWICWTFVDDRFVGELEFFGTVPNCSWFIKLLVDDDDDEETGEFELGDICDLICWMLAEVDINNGNVWEFCWTAGHETVGGTNDDDVDDDALDNDDDDDVRFVSNIV